MSDPNFSLNENKQINSKNDSEAIYGISVIYNIFWFVAHLISYVDIFAGTRIYGQK